MSSSLVNVKFNILGFTKDPVTKLLGLSPTPLATGLEGHLHDADVSPEGEVRPGIDRERNIRFRLTIRAKGAHLKFLKPGNIVLITHRRHPDAKSWQGSIVDSGEDTQFEIDARNNVDSVSRVVALGLKVKNQSSVVSG